MFVLGVTVLTRVFKTVVLICDIIRIVITMKYGKYRPLYKHYFYLVAKLTLLQRKVRIPYFDRSC